MAKRRTVILGIAALAALIAAGETARRYAGAMAEANRRVAPELARTVETRHGTMEYAEAGEGPAILMLHGSGGGFDQGLAIAAPLVARGYRVIAPSRFGYLGSDFPEDPGHDAQADALTDLLDRLRLERVIVIGVSAGAVPAISFAIRHPARCEALVALVPAVRVPSAPPVEPWTPFQARMVEAILGSDFLFWAAIAVAPRLVSRTILATDPAVIAAASPAEQARVGGIRDGILPVSRRARGLMNDTLRSGQALLDFAAVRAPTLAISLEDDLYQTDDSARAIAAGIPGAELIIYPSGGHVWVGHHDDLFRDIEGFLGRIGHPGGG